MELARSLLVVPDAMVCAVLVGVDALRMPLGIVLTALMVFAVLVGVDTLRVPLGIALFLQRRPLSQVCNISYVRSNGGLINLTLTK